jgi:Oxygen-sensitive ribonucleoside-triphosphate reductase
MTGSIGVVTINMARLGYLFKGDEASLVHRLFHLMDLAYQTLEKKAGLYSRDVRTWLISLYSKVS